MTERRARRRGPSTAVAGLVALTLLAGCASDSGSDTAGTTVPTGRNANVTESDGPGQPGGKIVYGLNAETNGWNPASSQWAPAGLEVSRTFFDTLSAYDVDSRIQPNLAQSFTPSADFTTWTIAIRKGVTLHNGKPVTAQVVADDQNFLKNAPLTRSAYDPVESISVNGDDVVVKTKKPWATYPYSLATQIGVVVDPDWLASGDMRSPIGTGPFRLDQWVPDAKLVVKKFSGYWRPGYPLLDEIEFRPIPDENSRAAALESGDLDLMMVTDGRQIAKYQQLGQEGVFQVFNSTSGETSESFVQLNVMSKLFSDPEARLALAYATDKRTYVDVLSDGQFEPADGPYPPSSQWHTETGYPPYDPAKATELVDRVKARNGGVFEFTLIGPPAPGTLEGMQLLQQQWKAVGIDARIDTLQQLDLILKVLNGDYEASMWQQFASPDPLGDSIWWHPDSKDPANKEPSLNFARNKDPQIGAALDAARTTPDRAAQKRSTTSCSNDSPPTSPTWGCSTPRSAWSPTRTS
ncbi:MAG: ABC transporter substrate-binding protein [Acidimicrobiales bacterium]